MKTRLFLFAFFYVFGISVALAQVIPIAGPTMICTGTSATYTLNTNVDLSDCDITWTFPFGEDDSGNFETVTEKGLTSINVSFPPHFEAITISASIAGCNVANSAVITPLSVDLIYLLPGQIDGIAFIPPGIQTETYTVTTTAGNPDAPCSSIGFSWDASDLSGWTVTGGTNSSSITLTSDQSSGGRLRLSITCDDCPEANLVSTSFIDISRFAPPLNCFADLDVACPGEANKLTVEHSSGLTVSNIQWVLSPVTNCNPCTGESIDAVTNSNGLVVATVRVTFDNGFISTCILTYWVGPPTQPTITYPNDPDCINENTNTTFFVSSTGASEYLWSFPSCAGSTGTGSTDPNDPDPNCWYAYDANPSTDSQMAVHVGENDGQVSVWATNRCGSSSSHIEVEICDTSTNTGGNNNGGGKPRPGGGGTGPHIPLIGQNPNAITTHPNPFVDLIMITGNQSDQSKSDFTYNIYNSFGQRISTGQFTSETKWNVNVETSGYESGIYFLEVRQQDEILYVDKIIKQ